MNISVVRPTEKDADEIYALCSATIHDAFEKKDIATPYEEIEETIEGSKNKFLKDLETNGRSVYTLVAKHEGKIVGIMMCGEINDMIKELYTGNLSDTTEIKRAYILPEFLGQGVGTLLLRHMLRHIRKNKTSHVCLDSGYLRGQRFWKKHLGEPTLLLKNYYQDRFDLMIWHKKLSEINL